MRLEESTDEELVAVYVDADTTDGERERAFLELVQRYERRIYSICYRHFGNHSDAEDAAQDTFLTLARKAHQFAGDSRLSTWLYRVAVNACNDLGRKYARRPQTPVEDVATAVADAGGDEASMDDVLAGRELAHEIEAALLQLDELSRNLIVMCSIEGLSYADASELFDLPVGTIKSRVFRARARLAELLEPATAATPTRPGTSNHLNRPTTGDPS